MNIADFVVKWYHGKILFKYQKNVVITIFVTVSLIHDASLSDHPHIDM